MVGFSQVSLLGAISEDPKVRLSATGWPMMELRVAGEERVGGRTFFWKHRVVVPAPHVEELWETLEKGQVIFVEGSLEVWIRENQGGSSPSGNGGTKKRLEVIRPRRLHPVEGKEEEVLVDELGRLRLRTGFSQAIVGGRLFWDPIVKETDSGNLLAVLLVETWTGGRPQRLDVLAWGELGKWASRLRQGDGVLAMGPLVNRVWREGPGNGLRRSRVEALRLERLTLGEERDEPLEVGVA